jgi:hypothetical protein
MRGSAARGPEARRAKLAKVPAAIADGMPAEGRVARVPLLHTGVSAFEGGIFSAADLWLVLLLAATGGSCVFQPSPVLWAFRSRNGCRGKEGFGEPWGLPLGFPTRCGLTHV